MNKTTDQQTAEWNRLLQNIRDMCEDYQDLVTIGGVAVWMHTLRMADERLLQVSHDADFYLSIQDFGVMRDLEEMVPNRRLGKYQIIKDDVDIDVYVDKQHGLTVPFADIATDAQEIMGIRCASLEHLLILKARAFLDRKNTAKGDKDARDIAKILILIGESGAVSDRLAFWTDEDRALVETIIRGNKTFLDIADGNAHDAKSYRQKATRGFEYVSLAANESEHPLSGSASETDNPGGHSQSPFD